MQRLGGGLDLRDQFQIIFQRLHGGQEDRQIMAARLDRDGGADRALDKDLFDPLLCGSAAFGIGDTL